MRRALLLLVLLVAGCGGSPTAPAPAAVVPGPHGDLTQAQLSALLLTASDLPGLPSLRAFSSATLTSQATPQLALCRPLGTDAPHELANVIAESPAVGVAKVFEVVSVYADAAAARRAYAGALAAARACGSYRVEGAAYRLSELAAVPAGAGTQALHYRLTTPSVVTGDVRTFAQRGRSTVLVTGYGAPPTGQPLLEYQAGLLRVALTRLP